MNGAVIYQYFKRLFSGLKLFFSKFTYVSQLCDVYDDVAATWLEGEDSGNASAIHPDLLRSWLRRATLDRQVIPVLCGTSLKNIGVQPLIDAVVHYLPQPADIRHEFT